MARVSLQEYCEEARELIDARAYDEAIAICRHILMRYPKHIKTYQILGEACLEKGEHEEAIDVFKRLLDHADPENLTAYAGLGFACQEQGQLTEAIWYMERALELAPNNEEARNALRRMYGERDGIEPTRIRHSKPALARIYARGGQYRQAIEEFRRLLALEPHHDRMDLKVSLAETLWRDGRREQAAELAREILQAAPDCLKATLLLGEILLEKGRRDEGMAVLDKARPLDPENRVAQALFGEHSPLPAQVILIPRMEPRAEAGPAPAAVAEPSVAPVAEAAAPVVEAAPEGEAEAAETIAVAAEPEKAEMEEEAAPPAVAETIPSTESLGEEVPVAEAEPAPPPSAEELPPSGTEEVGVTKALPLETEPAEGAEPVIVPAPEETGPAAPPAPEPVGEGIPAAGAEPTPTPSAAEAMPMKKRRKRAAPEEAVLESAGGVTAGPLSDIERYQLLVEQKPKDDELRLALARAYRDAAQIKSALEQYGVLLRARQKLLPEVIGDVEGIVASRPDNLQAHELLADLYAKNGQLQKALERYRWILQRLQQPT